MGKTVSRLPSNFETRRENPFWISLCVDSATWQPSACELKGFIETEVVSVSERARLLERLAEVSEKIRLFHCFEKTLTQRPSSYMVKKQLTAVWQSFLGHQLLKAALKKWSMRDDLHTQALGHLDRINGKPKCPFLEFNISHDANWVALVANDVNIPVGIDLCRAEDHELDASFLSPTEKDLVAQRLSLCPALPDREEHSDVGVMRQYWALKEALLKGFGIGLGRVALARIDFARDTLHNRILCTLAQQEHEQEEEEEEKEKKQVDEDRLTKGVKKVWSTVMSFPGPEFRNGKWRTVIAVCCLNCPEDKFPPLPVFEILSARSLVPFVKKK